MYKQYELVTGKNGKERICWLDRIDLVRGQQVQLDYERHCVVGTVWTVNQVFDEVTDVYQWRTYKVSETKVVAVPSGATLLSHS